MEKDYSNEVRDLIQKHKKGDISFGKSLNFLLSRIKLNQEEVEEEIFNCNNLVFTEKQIRNEEIRFALYFVYSRKRGRKYILTFKENKLKIITAFPLGRKTLKKYKKKGLNTR